MGSLRLTCASIAVLFSLQIAHAQEADPFDLGTLVLRGELQDRPLAESNTSAVIVSGEELEQRGDRDLFDLFVRTPGVNTTFGERGFNIRGIDQRGVGGAGSGLLITTQVDGVALPNEIATFFGPYSVWDLEQVEILRGPQSTQQGRNALAGAIILRSKDPNFDSEYRVRAEVGNRGSERLAFSANTPLIDDRLAFRFSADVFETDGYIFNTLLNEFADSQEVETYRAKLRWKPTDRFDAVLSYSFTDNQGGTNNIAGTNIAGPYVVQFDVPNINGATQSILGLRTEFQINDVWTLETETNGYENDYRVFEPLDGVLNGSLPFAPSFVQLINNSQGNQVFEQDVQLKFATDGVSGVVGLFFTQIDTSSNFNFSQFGTTRVSDTSGTARNYAIFGEIDIAADRWLPGLEFTLGARYDTEDLSFVNRLVVVPPVGPPTAPVFSGGSTSFDAFLPKLGVTYDFTEAQRVGFTVQRAYRAGGVRTRADGVLDTFDAEFATNYEFAYRGSFRDDRVQVSANVFFNSWEDQQVNVIVPPVGPVPGGLIVTDTINANSSESWGGELLIDAQVTTGLSVFGSAAYANTRFTNFPGFNGNSFANAPEWTWSAGAAYDFGNGATVSMDVAFTDETFGSINNNPLTQSDDYILVNAQFTYEVNNWLLGVYGRNILDERYAQRRQNFPNPFGPDIILTPGEPRTIGIFAEHVF